MGTQNIHRHGLAWALALVVFLGGSAASAKDEEGKPARKPSELELTTERAVVFKDGHALFVRRGRATADADARVFTNEVPDAAVLGCFWAFSKDDATLGIKARLVQEESATTTTSSCISMLDLLRANAGRVLTLRLTSNEEITGTLRGVLDREPRPGAPVQPPYVRPQSPQPAEGERERELVREGGALLVMDNTTRGEHVLPVSMVQSLTGKDLVTHMERRFEKTTVHKQLEFQLDAAKAGKEVEVQILYFAPGLRWIPTYRLAGDLQTGADLALQGEILNEAEDLEGVALDLVVGVPNFRFKEVVSPLVLEGALRNALNQAAPQLMGQMALSNAAFGARAGERRGLEAPVPAGLAPELAAGGAQDMFVYGVPGFSLKKGERATVPLWQSRVPLRHLYTLDIALGRDLRAGSSYLRKVGGGDRAVPLELARHDVWHQLELENKSQVPWTTGAALTMQGNVPIAQELLTYTPVQAKTLLPLTVAVDVRADFDEEETERLPNAVVYGGHQYARVAKKATVKLTNYRAEVTTMRVQLSLGGKALEASDGGTIRVNDYRAEDWSQGGYDARLNNHSDLEWNVTLKPGETRALTCAYEFYLR